MIHHRCYDRGNWRVTATVQYSKFRVLSCHVTSNCQVKARLKIKAFHAKLQYTVTVIYRVTVNNSRRRASLQDAKRKKKS